MENNEKNQRIKTNCGWCGKEIFIYPSNPGDSNPWDYMCKECNQKDDWFYHLRLLGLEKVKCVNCGWKLKVSDVKDGWESGITFKCPCCGLRFTLWHPDEY